MKRLRTACILVVICILSGITPNVFAEYADVYTYDSYYNSVNRLQDLGIISGYEDGLFHGDRYITRAEFAKVIVCAMDAENEAKTYGISSKFYDVPQGNWAVPYIAYVASKGIVSGYPDGSFGPSNTLTYAEALTIIGRMMGYTEDTIGAYWPTNYIEMASGIGITDGLPIDANAPINRAVTSIIIDRALFTKISKSSVSSSNMKTPILIESLGYTVLEDVAVLTNGAEDKTLDSTDVKLSDNNVYNSKMNTLPTVGEYFQYVVIDDNDNIVCVKSYTEDDATSEKNKYKVIKDCYIIATSAEDKTLSAMQIKTNKGTFTVLNSEILDKVGESGTLLLDKDNKVVSASTTSVTPVLASHDYSSSDTSIEGIAINYTNLTIYRDGKSASISDIKKNDVVYYNTIVNIMDVYSKKVTGIYYDAKPSKAYVTEVTIGGKDYVIGEESATKVLDASAGSFEIGEKVTLLLGKNDEVAFAVELADFNYSDFGIVTESGQKVAESGENEGSSETYVKIFMTDGEIYEYTADKNYKDYKGKLVRISYSENQVSLNLVSTASKTYGKIDKSARTIGGKTAMKDIKIIQRISGENESNLELEILNFDILETSALTSDNVIASVSANNFGDLAVLYVTGIENSLSYGIVKSYNIGEMGSTYKIYNSNGLKTYSSEGNYSLTSGSGVSFRELSNGTISEVKSLYKLKTASSIDAIEETRIMLNNEIFQMSTNVQIVDMTNKDNYRTISIDELSSKKCSSVTIYSDKSDNSIGEVKVIAVIFK